MRIMITGLSGAGKSTLAKKLHQQTGIPLYHLDKIFFTEHWRERNHDDFIQLQQDWVDRDNWIIDGNSTRSYETRYRRADVCIYLNPGFWPCAWRIMKRWLYHRDPTIDDRAPQCPERFSWQLFTYNWSFHQKRIRSRLYPLRHQYPQVRFIELRQIPTVDELIILLGISQPR